MYGANAQPSECRSVAVKVEERIARIADAGGEIGVGRRPARLRGFRGFIGRLSERGSAAYSEYSCRCQETVLAKCVHHGTTNVSPL